MKLDILKLMLGQEKIPAGWTSILPSIISLATPNAAFRYQTNSKYWFNLERILSKFPQLPTAGDELSLELLSSGDRAFIPADKMGGLGLQTIAQPGEATATGRIINTGKNKDPILDIWYSPGSIIEINFKNYTPGAFFVTIAALGRYYNLGDK